MNKFVGRSIKLSRTVRGLSKEELSDKIGFNIEPYEDGEPMLVDDFLIVCDALDLSPNQVLGYKVTRLFKKRK